ncbi:MAG: MATE family efflux transporter [Oleibacter sp.]|nr:MATE family efflux transporter [Thalassolituus sp.]
MTHSKTTLSAKTSSPQAPSVPVIRVIDVSQSRILNLSWPIILSNISVPLLGLIDTAILGHLNSTKPMAAVAIGAQVMTMVLWSFGFFRMSTTALTARRSGASDDAGVHSILRQALLFTLPISLLCTVLLALFSPTVLNWFGNYTQVHELAQNYITVRCWGIPLVFFQYCLIGWFIGRGETRVPLLMLVVANVVNAVLDYVFVWHLHLSTSGVALGTVIADGISVSIGLAVAFRKGAFLSLFSNVKNANIKNANIKKANNKNTSIKNISSKEDQSSASVPFQKYSTFKESELKESVLEKWRVDTQFIKRFVHINSDLFIRTITLLSVFAIFTAQGAKQGSDVVAANAIIISLLLFISNALDGFAHAAETLVGQTLGQKQFAKTQKAIWLTGVNCAGIALCLTLAFMLGSDYLLPLFTSHSDILATLEPLHYYLILLPLVGFASYWLDGIMIGAQASNAMRNSMLLAAFGIFIPWLWYHDTFLDVAQNHESNRILWQGLYAFLLARALFLLPTLVTLWRQPTQYLEK